MTWVKTDSDSVCEGSNPSPAAIGKPQFRVGTEAFLYFSEEFKIVSKIFPKNLFDNSAMMLAVTIILYGT